jgi:phosphoribosylformylglycinamidine synthase subunit PurQ / glutaminase
MFKPRACILRSAGTNCDRETAFAFSMLGCETELVHINKFIEGKKSLAEFHILALPGGFSHGDDIAAGKILANELRFKLAGPLREFVASGKLMIGICNGFQILVKSGLLPGSLHLGQEASLIINDSGSFQDRWVYLKSEKAKTPHVKCVWTEGLPEVIYLPIAHGEGKFVVKDETVLKRLKQNGQIVFRYSSAQGELKGYNPNGSLENIAGICDPTGRILGLMPHPERHIGRFQHPRWFGGRDAVVSCQRPRWSEARDCKVGRSKEKSGDGLLILKNGVDYVRNNFGR